MYRLSRTWWLVLSVAVLLVLPATVPAYAQQPDLHQPLDVMLVIDNSCSMFPENQRIQGCEVWGNDPDFLRITGADLFIARMGFAQDNAVDYQLGVVSLGDNPPELVSPLSPLAEGRDALARAIASPTPRLATQLLPALRMAYQELKESPRRRPGNLPAVVLLTDGAPFPAQGQSNEEIQALVEQYPDVPLFVILLQNSQNPVTGYDRYIRFWQDMQLGHSNVRSYPVNSTADIERTYDQIVAQLQNTVARPPTALAPGQTFEVFVNKYVQRLVLTVTRERGQPPGRIAITDPNGTAVQDDDPGVEHFRGADNPVEVISVGPERLDRAPRDAVWRITSDVPVLIHLDMEGAYRIQFVEPDSSVTSVPGQYLANQRQNPSQPLTIRFKLVAGSTGETILEPQPIAGRVVNPDGSTAELPVSPQLRPDSQGIYTIAYDLSHGYAAAADHLGRFVFSLDAGRIEDRAGDAFPIARADLIVDAGRGAYIAGLAPNTLQCIAGRSPVDMQVTVGDLDPALQSGLRVSVLAGGREIQLAPGEAGRYTGSLAPLCQAVQATLSCGTETDAALLVRLLTSDEVLAERTVSMHVAAPACTPTPAPTATHTPQPPPTATPAPTPTPAPPPVPDSDGDSIDDLADRCPARAQWSFLPLFQGCPPSLAMKVLGGLTGLGLLAFLAFYAAPLALVMTIQPPPAGYVQVFRNGKAEGSYKSLQALGRSARSRTITIGSQGVLRVAGLEPVEVRVERRGDTAIVLRSAGGPQLFLIRDIASTYTAADGNVILKFATDPKRLRH